ncbi:MAG: DNA replication/repair protein RecF [Acidothermus sp.]|nr:DNA replication/repair protein RecF [Acidothermus sp.]
MYLEELRLADFRSYGSLSLNLTPGVTVFVGANGQGKTNIVEAVGYLATLRSHRTAVESPLIREGASRARIRGVVVDDGRTTSVDVDIIPGQANNAWINGVRVRRVREILGICKAVVFSPEDLKLVRGDPASRREYLDDLLVSLRPRYAAIRSEYERTVHQRNAYLKETLKRPHRLDPSHLDVWDQQLCRAAEALLKARLSLTSSLAPLVEQAYAAVAGHHSVVRLEYRSSVPEALTTQEPEAAYLAAIHRLREAELARGITLVGPHRDDLDIFLDDRPARMYASHGEAWSLALALRLAAYEMFRRDGTRPILVLDDVLAELDSGRRQALTETIDEAEQVLLTTAVDEDLPKATRFLVRAGEVRRVD